MVVWCQRNKHHAVQCEVDIACKYEEVEQKELGCCPLKPDHRVKDKSVNHSLNCNVNHLNGHLHN